MRAAADAKYCLALAPGVVKAKSQPPNADVGLREKLISYCLKLVWEQEARRRSVVLVHRLTHLYVNVQLCSNNLGCFNRLPLTTEDDLRCA